MMFPDCRNDQYYNEDFLDKFDKREIQGYDWCLEQVVDNFFDNMDVYFDDDSHIMHQLTEKLPANEQFIDHLELSNGELIDRKVETYLDLIRTKLIEWVEGERDVLITSMIDNMDEDIFEARRNKVLKDNKKSEHPKEYYDTRKYFCTGIKESDVK